MQSEMVSGVLRYHALSLVVTDGVDVGAACSRCSWWTWSHPRCSRSSRSKTQTSPLASVFFVVDAFFSSVYWIACLHESNGALRATTVMPCVVVIPDVPRGSRFLHHDRRVERRCVARGALLPRGAR